MRIVRHVWISEGQIIWAILYYISLSEILDIKGFITRFNVIFRINYYAQQLLLLTK